MDGFEELPDHIQLDGQATTPTPKAPKAAAPSSFEELPDDIELDAPSGQGSAPRARVSATGYRSPEPSRDMPLQGTQKPVQLVDTSVRAGEFGDENHDDRPATTLSEEAKTDILKVAANPNSTAADLRAIGLKHGVNIDNAEDIIKHREQSGQVNKSFDERLPDMSSATDTTGAAGRGFLKGTTFRFLDELGAVADSLGGTTGRQNIFNSDLSFGDLYDRNVDMNRAIIAADENQHPIASYGGEILGSLATVPITGAAGEAVNAGRLGRGAMVAAEGAGTGALYGAGGADNGDRALGAIGGAVIGAGTGVVGDRVLGGMARQASRDAVAGREVLDAADALNAAHGTNIQPVASNVGGTVSQKLTGVSEQTILGSPQITRAADKLIKNTGAVVNDITGGKTLGEAGDDLLNKSNPQSLINLPTRLKERYDGFYERAGQLSGNIPLNTPKTLAVLDDEIKRLKEVPGGVAGLDKLVQLRKALTKGGTVNGLRSLRTSFGDSLDAGNRTVRTAAKRLWGPLSDDISEGLVAAGKSDAAQAYRRADTAFSNALRHTEVVNNLLDGKSGEQVATTLIGLSKKDDQLLEGILRMASPSEAKSIQGGIIQSLGRAKDSVQNAAGDVFSLESFLTNYNKLTDGAKSRIFNGQLRTDLNNLAKVAEGARRGRTFRNMSNTSGAMNGINLLNRFANFETVGRAGVSAMGGSALIGGIKGAAGSAMMGFLLSSPRVARALVRWGESGGTRADLIASLTKVAARTSAGQGADALNGFLGFLKSDGKPHAAGATNPDTGIEPLDENGLDEFDRTFGTEPKGDEPEDPAINDDETNELLNTPS